jgi:hypothetical protein
MIQSPLVSVSAASVEFGISRRGVSIQSYEKTPPQVIRPDHSETTFKLSGFGRAGPTSSRGDADRFSPVGQLRSLTFSASFSSPSVCLSVLWRALNAPP